MSTQTITNKQNKKYYIHYKHVLYDFRNVKKFNINLEIKTFLLSNFVIFFDIKNSHSIKFLLKIFN